MISQICSIKDIIEKLDKWLREHRPTYYQWLLPGIIVQEKRKFEDLLGFSMKEEFWELYNWRNGQNFDFTQAAFNPSTGESFLSLDRIIKSYLEMKYLLEQKKLLTGWWELEWVPFTELGKGSFYSSGYQYTCINMGTPLNGETGQVINYLYPGQYFAEEPKIIIVAPNLKTWLSDLIINLEREEGSV